MSGKFDVDPLLGKGPDMSGVAAASGRAGVAPPSPGGGLRGDQLDQMTRAADRLAASETLSLKAVGAESRAQDTAAPAASAPTKHVVEWKPPLGPDIPQVAGGQQGPGVTRPSPGAGIPPGVSESMALGSARLASGFAEGLKSAPGDGATSDSGLVRGSPSRTRTTRVQGADGGVAGRSAFDLYMAGIKREISMPMPELSDAGTESEEGPTGARGNGGRGSSLAPLDEEARIGEWWAVHAVPLTIPAGRSLAPGLDGPVSPSTLAHETVAPVASVPTGCEAGESVVVAALGTLANQVLTSVGNGKMKRDLAAA